jgi:hypothetical protein
MSKPEVRTRWTELRRTDCQTLMPFVLDGERNEVTLAAFDVIELQGDDLRDEPLLKRKQRLARGGEAITLNEHLNHGAHKTRSTTMQNFFCDMMRRCSVQRSDWKTNADAICTLRSSRRASNAPGREVHREFVYQRQPSA